MKNLLTLPRFAIPITIVFVFSFINAPCGAFPQANYSNYQSSPETTGYKKDSASYNESTSVYHSHFAQYAPSELDDKQRPKDSKATQRTQSPQPASKTVASPPQDSINDQKGKSQNKSNAKTLDLSTFNGRITFDDGPHPDTTPCLVRMLNEANVRNAVFFFLGYRILEYPTLVSLVVNAGYEIGYHSMFHQNFTELTTKQIREDIKQFRKALNHALGKSYDLKIGRPPFGGMTKATVEIFRKLEKDGTLAKASLNQKLTDKLVDPKIIKEFKSEHLELLLWNVDFDDWKKKLNTKIVLENYSTEIDQVWLLHEKPVDWVTLQGYDNDLAALFPSLLDAFNQVQKAAQTTPNLIRAVQEKKGQ